jgi:hypothetical protein
MPSDSDAVPPGVLRRDYGVNMLFMTVSLCNIHCVGFFSFRSLPILRCSDYHSVSCSGDSGLESRSGRRLIQTESS